MKNIIILIFFLFIIYSCTDYDKRNKIEHINSISLIELPDIPPIENSLCYLFPNYVQLREDLNAFISDFIREINKENYILELYVDKKNYQVSYFTLFDKPADSLYFSTHLPLYYTLIESIPVFIYTGLEDFIPNKYYHLKMKLPVDQENSGFLSSASTLVICKDSSFVLKDFGLTFTDSIIDPERTDFQGMMEKHYSIIEKRK